MYGFQIEIKILGLNEIANGSRKQEMQLIYHGLALYKKSFISNDLECSNILEN